MASYENDRIAARCPGARPRRREAKEAGDARSTSASWVAALRDPIGRPAGLPDCPFFGRVAPARAHAVSVVS